MVFPKAVIIYTNAVQCCCLLTLENRATRGSSRSSLCQYLYSCYLELSSHSKLLGCCCQLDLLNYYFPLARGTECRKSISKALAEAQLFIMWVRTRQARWTVGFNEVILSRESRLAIKTLFTYFVPCLLWQEGCNCLAHKITLALIHFHKYSE